MSDSHKRRLSPLGKQAVEFGPLLAFFLSYAVAKRVVGDDAGGLIWATGVFVVASLAAVVAAFRVEGRIPPVTIVTTILVVVLGGLTIALDDETFIKRKATYVSGSMGLVLLGGLALGRSLLRPLLGTSLELDDVGWKKLTLRFGFFFLFIAGLNEVIWRHMSTDHWIAFKTFGIVILTLVFMVSQFPLLRRHLITVGERAEPTSPENE